MRVVFWGTRGSLPRAVGADAVREKVRRAVEAALESGLAFGDDVDAFLSSLPFDVLSTFGGSTPCVEIRTGEPRELLVLDAGTGLRDLSVHLGRAGPSPPLRVHLLLSHLHWDHIQGFPFFTPAYVPGNEIHVYGCHDGIEEAFRRQQEAPFFPVPLGAMGASIAFHRLDVVEPATIAGFGVTSFLQNHPGNSYGYLLERDGTRVVYSTDSEHYDEAFEDGYPFVDMARDADLLVFDAAYSLADQLDSKKDWGHSSNTVGVELAMRAGVRRLCLFHHDHALGDDALERIREETAEYLEIFAGDDGPGLEIVMAYDGLEIEL